MNLYISPDDLDSASEGDSDEEGFLMSADDAFDEPIEPIVYDSDSEDNWAPETDGQFTANVELSPGVVVVYTPPKKTKPLELEEVIHIEEYIKRTVQQNSELYEKHKVKIELDVSSLVSPLPPSPTLTSLPFEKDVTCAAFSPVSALLMAVDYSGCILAYERGPNESFSENSIRLMTDLEDGEEDVFSCLAFTPDGSSILTGRREGGVTLYGLSTKTPHHKSSSEWKFKVRVVKIVEKNCGQQKITCLKCVGNDMFVTGDDTGLVCLWDHRPKGRALARWRLGNEEINDIVVGGKGEGVYACCDDGAVGKWDLRTKTLMEECSYATPISCMALLDHDTLLVLGDIKGTLRVVDDRLGDDCSTLPSLDHRLTAIVPISDTRFLVGDTRGHIYHCSVSPPSVLGTLTTTVPLGVDTISVSCDVALAAVASSANYVALIDLSTALEDLQPPPSPRKKRKRTEDHTEDAMKRTVDHAEDTVSISVSKPDR